MALQGSMLDRPPVRGTDVRQDPNYWIQQLTNPNRRMREQAALVLEDLQRRELLNQRLAEVREGREARLTAAELTRQQNREIHDETLAATVADRETKNAIIQANAFTRRAEELQMAMNDPNLPDDVKASARAEYIKILGLQPGTAGATAPTMKKGEYGPETAKQAPTPEKTTTTYTPPTRAFTEQPRGIPARPTPSRRYYQESRYPASEGFTPRDRTRIAKNLDRAQREDERFNEIAYKRDIGGENYARLYGTEAAVPGQPLAAGIPQLYAGTPTIPDVSPVGYYDKAGNFLGPLYTEGGAKLPMPRGATGLHGTAAIPGVVIDPVTGRSIATTPEARAAMAGRFPIATSIPLGVAGPYGEANKPPGEEMIAGPVGEYQPPTVAFVAPPTGLEKGAGGIPQPSPPPTATPTATPIRQPVHEAVGAALNFLFKKGAPFGTPPPQASNDRRDLLRETEETFYGGGQAPPVPTPTPTPDAQRLAEVERQRQMELQRQAELRRLALEEARRRGLAGSNYAFA